MQIEFDYTSGKKLTEYYASKTDSIIRVINAVINIACIPFILFCTVAIVYVCHNIYNKVLALMYQLVFFGFMIFWMKTKDSDFFTHLVEDGLSLRNYHRLISKQLEGVEWEVVYPGDECCGLSKNGQFFLVYFYMKETLYYGLQVFKKNDEHTGETTKYDFQLQIRLNSLVPSELYNSKVFNLIRDNDGKLLSPLSVDSGAYEAHILSAQRKYTIDDILANLS